MAADEPAEHEPALADEPDVRQALAEVDRASIASVVARHPSSPLAWAELADVADSEGRWVEALAFAAMAVDLAREQLSAAGWTPGSRVPWSAEPNRAYLRALDAKRRAALQLGLDERASRLADELASADAEAPARIRSEFTPTQLMTVVGADGVFDAASRTEGHTGEPLADPTADAAGED
ncbi:DUF3151 family protein [Agromyces sp. Marseille-P2726]|uniref:DUF3151 family protein n=1 Tax=Agromyces sp. Marseille-P2726 TaxID=2709132 RepID=UPI00156D9577|nr:DUF3151 family protein [Agromyces sp. Marseille-P2726]